MQTIKNWFYSEIFKHILHTAEGGALGWLAAKGLANPDQLKSITAMLNDPAFIAGGLALISVAKTALHLNAVKAAATPTSSPNTLGQQSVVLTSPHMAPAIVLACILAFSFTARAERDDLPPPDAATNAPAITKTNLVPVVGAVADWFKSVKPFLTNNDVIVYTHFDYSSHTHRIGYGGAVLLPINNLIYAGFGATHINGNTFYGPLTLSIGKEFDVWAVGKTYLYATTGPNLQFGHGATLGAESSTGFEKAWKVNEKWTVGVSGAVVNITQESGMILRAGPFVSYKW